MTIKNILKTILGLQKTLDIKQLPSLGLFYKDDFEIQIQKVDMEEIIEYEYNFVKDDLGLIIKKLKKIVEKNAILSENYTFNDIKSIDIVFIFLEIVKFTTGKNLIFTYFDDELNEEKSIEFTPEHFNYFTIDEGLMKYYDSQKKQFIINDYKFSLPSIGLENSLTEYLISVSKKPDAVKYNNFIYDFTYFLSDKNYLSPQEVENLIEIFNFDMDSREKEKVRSIVKMFQPLQKYSLRKGHKVIEINAQIDLEKIWR